MPQLLPVFDVPDMIDEDAQYDREYRRSMKWDPEKGDFVRDGANRIAECDGMEAYVIWCFKVAQTERYRCLAYPAYIGTELESATDDDREVVQSMAERTITDALLVNPRTEYVRDFVFEWDADALHVTFTVKGVGMEGEFEITL